MQPSDGKTIFRLKMMLDPVGEINKYQVYDMNQWIVDSSGITRAFFFVGLILA